MKKIFKKSLALAVSAALCLTALVGCLTVSAAGTATASISSVEVANGSTSATITVTIGSADDQVAAARFNLVAAEGITLDTSDFDSTATNGDGYTGNGFTVISNGNMFLLEAENEVLASAASFDIPVTIADGTTAATYAVSFGDVLEVANYGTYDSTTQTWSNDEALLTVSPTNGGVTVAAAAAACEHEYEVLSITPATDASTGSITFKCGLCEDTYTEDISYTRSHVLDAASVGCTSTTQLILNARAARFAEGETYVVVTHAFANGAPSETEILKAEDSTVSGTAHSWVIGVKTTNFSDVFSTVLVTKLNGAWVCGTNRDFSIKAVAEAVVTSGAENLKPVAANLLTMGAKIQLAFNQATDALADAGLTGDLAAYVTTTTPSVVKDTTTNWIVDNSDAQSNGKVGFGAPAVVLSDAISLQVKGNFRYYTGATDALKLVVSYTSYNGAEVSKEITDYDVNGNTYSFMLDMIAPDMRTPVTVQVYNGDTAISNPAVYSIESALANALASADTATQNAIYAVMNYSDAARASFS